MEIETNMDSIKIMIMATGEKYKRGFNASSSGNFIPKFERNTRSMVGANNIIIIKVRPFSIPNLKSTGKTKAINSSTELRMLISAIILSINNSLLNNKLDTMEIIKAIKANIRPSIYLLSTKSFLDNGIVRAYLSQLFFSS